MQDGHISTHAPLAGRDCRLTPYRSCIAMISTHAPLAGRDKMVGGVFSQRLDFNPRAPCGARQRESTLAINDVNFNPRAPCGARLFKLKLIAYDIDFNPRAPCGARLQNPNFIYENKDFNPRAPCGARQQKCTNPYAHFCDNRQISDAFAQNAACQGILLLFDAGKPCGFWVRTAQVISARLCFAL